MEYIYFLAALLMVTYHMLEPDHDSVVIQSLRAWILVLVLSGINLLGG